MTFENINTKKPEITINSNKVDNEFLKFSINKNEGL